LKHFETYAAAWTYEHALIEQMQAPLNHPLISKHLSIMFTNLTKGNLQA